MLSKNHLPFSVQYLIIIHQLKSSIPQQFYYQSLTTMSYITPKRRHSSLFQRMEQEIYKISRKLSVAKDWKERDKEHSFHSKRQILWKKQNTLYSDKKGQRDISKDTHTIQTVRRRKDNDKLIGKSYCHQLQDTNHLTPKNPTRRLKLTPSPLVQEPASSELLQQTLILSHRLTELQNICQSQAYKIGYLKAANRERQNELAWVKNQSLKESVYLQKLAEGYRMKIQKYKEIVGGIAIGSQDL